jgi:hypothetical protein
MTGARMERRLEKLENKARPQGGRVLQMIVDENDPAREERIEAFRSEHNMTDADLLIVRVIVHPPSRPA